MFYEWKNVERERCPEIVKYTRFPPQDIANYYYTHGGQALKKCLPKVTFLVRSFDGLFEQDSLWAGLPYLVFSSRLRQSLSNAGVTNIEYYPISIVHSQTKEIVSDYSIANIVGLISCMNMQRSVYEFDPEAPGRVETISTLVLDESRIPSDIQLFRLAEKRTIILCNANLRSTLITQSVTGIRFTEVESV